MDVHTLLVEKPTWVAVRYPTGDESVAVRVAPIALAAAPASSYRAHTFVYRCPSGRWTLKDEIVSKHVETSPEFGAAATLAERLLENIELVVRGKRSEIELVLCALFCRGHVLFEDVPGTAKTVLARAIAQSIEDARASRIQCTPDLQPTDVTGLSIYNQKEREFEFRAGPGVREHRPRRRDQPRDAAHAVGAARGDGRAADRRSTARRGGCPTRS